MPDREHPHDPSPAAGDGGKGDAAQEATEPVGEEFVKGSPGGPDPDAEVDHADAEVPSRDVLRAALTEAFGTEDEPPSDAVLDQFALHAEMMLDANRRMNLTAILDPSEVAVKHYLDSWRAGRYLPLMGRTILDLGSGAGFPGIPIAVGEPNAQVTLIDSTRKRVDFLEQCIETLDAKNLSAVWDRAEEHLARNRSDVVFVRGVSSVRENVRLLRKVRHSCKDLVMLKGPSWSREMRAGEREVERLGFRLDTVWEHELPFEMGARAILVYRAPGGMGE